jgi:hypothetical protein
MTQNNAPVNNMGRTVWNGNFSSHDHCHQVTTQLQLINIIIIMSQVSLKKANTYLLGHAILCTLQNL